MITDELERLRALHDDGTLTDAEFAGAKTKALTGDDGMGGAALKDIQALRLQTELLRVDQDWTKEREKHMLYREEGGHGEPNSGAGSVAAVLFGVIGLITLAIGGKDFSEITVPLGLLLLAAGIGIGIYSHSTAKAYEEALERYQQQRGLVMGQLEALNQQKPQ